MAERHHLIRRVRGYAADATEIARAVRDRLLLPESPIVVPPSPTPPLEPPPPVSPPPASTRRPIEARASIAEAEATALLQGFADTYAQTIGIAAETIAESVSPRQRILAQHKKVASATRAYAIATQPNPEVGLVDMVVNVTVERAVWNGGLAREAFGDKAAVLTKAYDELHEEVWALAAKVMTKEQLAAVDQAITKWLAEHPDRRYASIVRFEELAKYRTAPIMDIGAPGGLKMLAPVSEALRTTESMRLLGERAVFLLQRMPTLANWQVELLTSQLLDDVESRRLLRDVNTLARSVHRVVDLASQALVVGAAATGVFALYRALAPRRSRRRR